MVQLPHVFISGLLAATMIILVGYTMILKPFVMWLYDMSYINFDIIFVFQEMVFLPQYINFSMLNSQYLPIFSLQ